MSLSFNCPLNSVSFGQVSIAILRELHKAGEDVLISPIGNKTEIESQEQDLDLFKWMDGAVKSFDKNHKRESPALRLWHLHGSNGFISDNQALFTFHELDNLTETEVNIAKNNKKLILSSRFSTELFKGAGIDAHHVPLGFDYSNFKVTDKKYHDDERIVFTLCGKFEHRKHHARILAAWASKYGNDSKYFLQSALYNPFVNPQTNNDLVARALSHKKYFNMTFHPQMPKNAEYNDFLNSSNIVIGMSGGEGWALPEFQSVALGKHAVILNAHAYRDWATTDNAVLVDPAKKIDCYDGMFFKKGGDFNQGQIFSWDEDDFLEACEVAISRVEANRINVNGLKLQEEFTYAKTLEGIMNVLKE